MHQDRHRRDKVGNAQQQGDKGQLRDALFGNRGFITGEWSADIERQSIEPTCPIPRINGLHRRCESTTPHLSLSLKDDGYATEELTGPQMNRVSVNLSIFLGQEVGD